jgi:hypothetical protein
VAAGRAQGAQQEISVVDRLREKIGTKGAAVEAAVEAGHLKRWAEAIGDTNPRWLKEAPPTFLVGLAPASYHIPEAEDYGKGWLNGGNKFEYLAPVKVGDRITAQSTLVDVYEKSGGSGGLLFLVFETEIKNQNGQVVAKLRGTGIRR